MPSFACKPPAAKPLTVDSARCPRTTRLGNRSATPLPAGASVACGMRCWRCCASKCAPRRAGGQAGQARRGHHRLPIGQGPLKRGQCGYDAGKRVKGRKRHTQTPHSRRPELLVQHAAAPRIAARINLPLWHTAGTLLYAGQWLCATVCCGGWHGAEPESKTRAISRGAKMAFAPFPLGPDALITRAKIRHPSTPELLGCAWLGQKERRRVGLRSS